MIVYGPRDTRSKRFMAAIKMQPLGVFLASANKAQYEALSLVFEQQQGADIVGGAMDTHGVLEGVPQCHTDILLLDWELPVQSELFPGNGESAPELAVPDLIKLLRSTMEKLHIIVLTLKPEIKCEALAAGADAVVAKTSSPEKMLASLINQINSRRSTV